MDWLKFGDLAYYKGPQKMEKIKPEDLLARKRLHRFFNEGGWEKQMHLYTEHDDAETVYWHDP